MLIGGSRKANPSFLRLTFSLILYRSKRKVRQVSGGVDVLVDLIQLSWSEGTCTFSEICQKRAVLRNGYVNTVGRR